MIWVSVQKFGTLFISFLSNIVLARLLTPSDYGMVGMLAIFIAISNTFIDGGFGSALIQKSRPTQKDYTTVFYWNILLSIILYFILFTLSPFIEKFYHDIHGLSKILRIQGLVLMINAMNIVQFNQLRKRMQFKLLARINITSAIASVIIAIILAYIGLGVWALVIQQVSLSMCNSILLWTLCKWHPSGWISIQSIRELFSFGSFIMMSSIVNTIGNNINGLLIGKFFSAGTLGYFTQAKRLEDVTSLGILNVVEQVSYPMLVEVKDDYKRMTNVLANFSSSILAVTMPLLFTLILIAKPAIVFLYSDKWLQSVPILQILAIYGIFIVMQGCNYNAIAAIGKSSVLFRWTIYKRIASVAIILIFLLCWGFNGLLIGIVVTGALIALSNMYLVSRYIGFSIKNQFLTLMPVFLISAVPFITFWLIKIFICASNGIYFDLLTGLGYVLVYIVAMLFIPGKSISLLRNNIKLIWTTVRNKH